MFAECYLAVEGLGDRSHEMVVEIFVGKSPRNCPPASFSFLLRRFGKQILRHGSCKDWGFCFLCISYSLERNIKLHFLLLLILLEIFENFGISQHIRLGDVSYEFLSLFPYCFLASKGDDLDATDFTPFASYRWWLIANDWLLFHSMLYLEVAAVQWIFGV